MEGTPLLERGVSAAARTCPVGRFTGRASSGWSSRKRREKSTERLKELSYVRFTLVPLARAQRASAAGSSGLGSCELEMRRFLNYVLQAYEAHGVEELSLRKIRDFLRIRYGGTNDAKAALGSVAEIRKAFIDIQGHLFR
ncbi:type I restriction-modification enzyme R subunit C-terminal domain-containing protein [Rhodosalinus sp.]|uniref:type I restriction-modification enzyme R subunit C-terminal domain-containing protein n=1 Tax=Rhodosalinus sp. TaxID=2047741 RepID=UPI00397A7E40